MLKKKIKECAEIREKHKEFYKISDINNFTNNSKVYVLSSKKR